MLKLRQQGFAHILLIIFLLAGLAGGVYLVQQKTNILPKASGPTFTTPTTSFELLPANPSDNYYKVGDLIPVNVRARSDISEANLFNAKITFDKDLLAVDNVYTANSFVKNWVENTFDNNAGIISLVGGVPSPGYKTDNNSETGKILLMAIVNFKVLKPGSASINLTDDSAIFSNADNINILTVKQGATIKIGDRDAPPADSGSIPSMPTALWGSVTIDGAPAKEGLSVYAMVNGKKVATTTTDSNGCYGFKPIFRIPMPASVIPGSGKDIAQMYVNEKLAGTVKIESGSIKGFPLSLPTNPFVEIGSDFYINGHVTTEDGAVAKEGITLTAAIEGAQFNRQDYHKACIPSTPKATYGTATTGKYKDQTVVSIRIPADDPNTPEKDGGIEDDIVKVYVDEKQAGTTTLLSGYKKMAQKRTGYDDVALVVSNDLAASPSVSPTPSPAMGFISSTVSTLKGLIGANTPTPAAPTITSVPAPTATTSPADLNCGRSVGTGDANNDGKVDLQDMSILLSDFGKTSGSNQAIDMNGECTINVFDVLLMRKVLIEKDIIKGS